VHRSRGSGRLWLTRGVDMCALDFSDGEIVGCVGFTTLLDGIVGERSWSVAEWASALDGGDEGQAHEVVHKALCKACLDMDASGDWMLNFVVSEPVQSSASLARPLTSLVAEALREGGSEGVAREWLAANTEQQVVVQFPKGMSAREYGLDQRLVEAVEGVGREPSVSQILAAGSAELVADLGILHVLGLVALAQRAATHSEIGIESGPSAQPQEGGLPVDMAADPGTEEVTVDATDEQPMPPSSGQPRSRRGPASDRSKKRRRLDPRVIAVKRDPGKSPPELIEAHLKEAYDVLTRSKPEFIFRLKKSADLERSIIDKKHREACARYHPDRYRNAAQGAQALAEGCFTAVSEAYHRLIEREYFDEVKTRFIERETGVKVVTETTRSRARIDFAKAEALFKQKRFPDAHANAKAAVEGDPDKWQYQYLMHRAAFRAGLVQIDEAHDGIIGLTGMTTVEKADQLAILGEMHLKSGDEVKAYKLFAQAVSLDSQNVVASRRLRLRERRQREEGEKAGGGGLFGGLFQRRK